MITELNENNFSENVSKGLKLVFFHAVWCGYCAKQRIELNEMKNITIYGVNGDENPSLLRKYGVHSFPTFIIFKDGHDVRQFSGLHNKFDLMNVLTEYMK